MNPTWQLHQAGQSRWLDSINRAMLWEGTLARYIDQLAVTGVVSGPTISGPALLASCDDGPLLRRHLGAGVPGPEQLVFAAAWEDITTAADLLGSIAVKVVAIDRATLAREEDGVDRG